MQPVDKRNDKPPQLELQHLPAEEKGKLQALERAEEFRIQDIQKLIREAKGNLEIAQRKQKYYYDQKRREVNYKVGDEVLKIKHALSNAPEEKDPRRQTSTKDSTEWQQQEPATIATRDQKQKAPPQQSRGNKKRKFTRGNGLKRKNTENRNSTNSKRPKKNGQGQPKAVKRRAEMSERSLRSKQPRLQPEDQRPEYSRRLEQPLTRAQE
ncbi:hypothetical protein X975_24572, partial [Stegodyphus mimosarum]